MAAENGSAEAQCEIAIGLIDSDDPEQFAQGITWLKKAALQKNPSPYAQYELAHLMELGRAGPDCYEERWRLYEAAAKGGVPEAMFALGRCLEHGVGVGIDTDAAIKWYIRAAEGGEDEGYLRAGVLSGSSTHLEKAAKAGYVEAMLILAPKLLTNGLGNYGCESFLRGLSHYERAADADNLEAVLALADIYENGWLGQYPEWDGSLPNFESRYECLENSRGYYEHAQELGYEWAASNIQRISKLLLELEKISEEEGCDD